MKILRDYIIYYKDTNLFNDAFPNLINPISRCLVARIVQWLNKEHSVQNKPRSERRSLLDVMKALIINKKNSFGARH